MENELASAAARYSVWPTIQHDINTSKNRSIQTFALNKQGEKILGSCSDLVSLVIQLQSTDVYTWVFMFLKCIITEHFLSHFVSSGVAKSQKKAIWLLFLNEFHYTKKSI